MADFSDIDCVLLAAGSSVRFGSNKLLHTLPNGKSLLASTLNLYSRVFANISVVVDPQGQDLDRLCSIIKAQGAAYTYSPNADFGLSQSLVAGVQASSPTIGWLIALADMPYLQVETLRLIAKSLQPNNIVIPKSSNGVGNPVGFGKNFAVQLSKIQGDRGAKSVVQSNEQSLLYMLVNDLGIHHDIDTIGDIRP